jgi:hypothetical protein
MAVTNCQPKDVLERNGKFYLQHVSMLPAFLGLALECYRYVNGQSRLWWCEATEEGLCSIPGEVRLLGSCWVLNFSIGGAVENPGGTLLTIAARSDGNLAAAAATWQVCRS